MGFGIRHTCVSASLTVRPWTSHWILPELKFSFFYQVRMIVLHCLVVTIRWNKFSKHVRVFFFYLIQNADPQIELLKFSFIIVLYVKFKRQLGGHSRWPHIGNNEPNPRIAWVTYPRSKIPQGPGPAPGLSRWDASSLLKALPIVLKNWEKW